MHNINGTGAVHEIYFKFKNNWHFYMLDWGSINMISLGVITSYIISSRRPTVPVRGSQTGKHENREDWKTSELY
jgi:hypothetical protein